MTGVLHRKKGIVVVTSEIERATHLVQVLRSSMFHVRIESNGWNAWNLARAQPPSLVMIDAALATMRFSVLCRLFQRYRATSRIPLVVFVDGVTSAKAEIEAFSAGAVDYLAGDSLVDGIEYKLDMHIDAARQQSIVARDVCAAIHGTDRLRRLLSQTRRVVGENGWFLRKIEDLVQPLGVSPRHLSGILKRHSGAPLHAHMVRSRMERAKQLLLETNMGVAEISQVLGYQWPCNFTSAFTRQYGVAPLRLRRSHMGNLRKGKV